MSMATILLAIVGVASAILGAFLGHARGKSVGTTQGAEQARAEQQVIQAHAIVEAVQERNDVEANVAVTPRADIDRELQEFSRPD